MKAVVCLVLLALFCAPFLARAEEEAVVTLTASNFDEIVNPADIILVEFYAPWCGHCKHLAPEYEKAAQTLKSNDPPIILAKVDATVETDLGSRFSIQGYPTMKIFRQGKEFEYKGPRDAAGIINYMQKQAGGSSKSLKTVADVEAFTTNLKDDVVLVGFFDGESQKGLKAFRGLADKLRDDFLFAEVTSQEVADHFKYKNQVVAFKKYDEKLAVYEGELTAKNLESFLTSHSVARVGELTAVNKKRYEATGLPLVTVYFDVDHEKNVKRTNYYLRRLEKVEEAFTGKAKFAIAELSLLPPDQAPEANKEVVTLHDQKNDQTYKFTGTFGVEPLKKFVTDFLAGSLKPYIKSEPIPASNDGPVTVVVGENFNSVVLDNDKDVLVEFYAPWCGHCKSLAPIWDKLGEKVKEVSTLTVAKIDATANDYPKSKFAVSGFPTIFLKKASGEIVKYEGAREVKDFVSFLEKNVTHKFSLKGEKSEKAEKKDEKAEKKDKKADKKSKKSDKKSKKQQKEEL